MGYFTTNAELDATKFPAELDIAWSAGIYEGEGHCRRRKSQSGMASVVQKDPEILYRLRDWFGGSIRLASAKTVPQDRWCYAWNICGDRCRAFLAVIYPYLSARRKAQVDAIEALAFLNGAAPDGMSFQEIRNALAERAAALLSADPKRVRKTELAKAKRHNSQIPKSPFDSTLNRERVM
jgi:hypothetical protein